MPSLIVFRNTIQKYYAEHRRSFPWRELDWNSPDTPYHIVVSEIMLQQTQAPRVVPKFLSFIEQFPNWESLAQASNAYLLREWQGLGYNRRALYLKHIAKMLQDQRDERNIYTKLTPTKMPQRFEELIKFPGIGPNTAGSILAFAWNIPHPFIETNIRTVFIHFFFKNKRRVSDAHVLKLVEASLKLPKNQSNPREWYYALMDYGVMLKESTKSEGKTDPARKSATYKKQSKFKGSNRELRAAILKTLLAKPQSEKMLIKKFKNHKQSASINTNLKTLVREGFLKKKKGVFLIQE